MHSAVLQAFYLEASGLSVMRSSVATCLAFALAAARIDCSATCLQSPPRVDSSKGPNRAQAHQIGKSFVFPHSLDPRFHFV